MGLTMHFVYTLTLTIYINEVYLMYDNQNQDIYLIMLSVGLLYPMYYETKQIRTIGSSNYLTDINNYMDMLYIWGSVANVFLQYFLGPQNVISEIIMILIVI